MRWKLQIFVVLYYFCKLNLWLLVLVEGKWFIFNKGLCYFDGTVVVKVEEYYFIFIFDGRVRVHCERWEKLIIDVWCFIVEGFDCFMCAWKVTCVRVYMCFLVMFDDGLICFVLVYCYEYVIVIGFNLIVIVQFGENLFQLVHVHQ